jgi:dihydroxyacetone kinase-like protein
MDRFTAKDIKTLFDLFARTFADQKEALIALDGQVGDSDLGLTMAQGFNAANKAVGGDTEENIASLFKIASIAIARAAPSTMGTLMATGFSRGSTAVKECDSLGTSEMATFWKAFCEGVAQRGHAQLGDKTVLDVLHPISETLMECSVAGVALPEALEKARVSAAEALDASTYLVAQRGKAAAFQEKSRGVQDAGATVAVILIDIMSNFAREK